MKSDQFPDQFRYGIIPIRPIRPIRVASRPLAVQKTLSLIALAMLYLC